MQTIDVYFLNLFRYHYTLILLIACSISINIINLSLLSFIRHFNILKVCTNCTRVYVQKDIFEIFLNELVEATSKLKIGNPFDEDTVVGAVINMDHGNKILKYINSAVHEVCLFKFQLYLLNLCYSVLVQVS